MYKIEIMGSSNGAIGVIIFITLLLLTMAIFYFNSWRWKGGYGNRRRKRRCEHGGECGRGDICIKNYCSPTANVKIEDDHYNGRDGEFCERPCEGDSCLRHHRTNICGCGGGGCNRCRGDRDPCDPNDGRAGDTCSTVNDCIPGLACVNGFCTQPFVSDGDFCNIDADCNLLGQNPERRCVGGFCSNTCATPADCISQTPGSACVQGVCNVPPGMNCEFRKPPGQQITNLCLNAVCSDDNECVGSLICSPFLGDISTLDLPEGVPLVAGTRYNVCTLPVNGPIGVGGDCDQTSDCNAGLQCVMGQCIPNLQGTGFGAADPSLKTIGDSGAPCTTNLQCPGSSCAEETYFLYTYNRANNAFTLNNGLNMGASIIDPADVTSIIDLDVRSASDVRFLQSDGSNTFTLTSATESTLAAALTDGTYVLPSTFTNPNNGFEYTLIPDVAVLASHSDIATDIFYALYFRPAGVNETIFLPVRVFMATPDYQIEAFGGDIPVRGAGNRVDYFDLRNNGGSDVDVILTFATGWVVYVSNTNDTNAGQRTSTIVQNATLGRFMGSTNAWAYIDLDRDAVITMSAATGSTAAAVVGSGVPLGVTFPNNTIVDYAFDVVNPSRGLLITDDLKIVFFSGSARTVIGNGLEAIVNNSVTFIDAKGAELFIIAHACIE